MFLNSSLYFSVFSTDTEMLHLGGVMGKGSKDREDTDKRMDTTFRGVNGEHLPEMAFCC